MTKEELVALICEIYDIPDINTMIEQQINKFFKQGISYKDIGRAISFYIEEQGNLPKKEMGIGIIPYVVDEARNFYEKKKQEQNKLRQEALKLKQQHSQRTIKVKPVRKVKRYKINIEDL
jgi:hypothetical protein